MKIPVVQGVAPTSDALHTLDRPITHEGGSAVLRPRVGIATLPEHGFDPAELLMAADVSCHIAATREEGYHVFQGDEAVESEVYRGLDLDLERAVRANELEILWQPQVSLTTGRPVGAEALVRWNHAQAGDVPPKTLVGIAERTGLIGTLTYWILNAALRQHAAWRDAGIRPPRAKRPAKKALPVPADLSAALKRNRKAHTTFTAFSPSHRREYIEWITGARRDATRARRIETAVGWMAEGKPHNWKYMK